MKRRLSKYIIIALLLLIPTLVFGEERKIVNFNPNIDEIQTPEVENKSSLYIGITFVSIACLGLVYAFANKKNK